MLPELQGADWETALAGVLEEASGGGSEGWGGMDLPPMVQQQVRALAVAREGKRVSLSRCPTAAALLQLFYCSCPTAAYHPVVHDISHSAVRHVPLPSCMMDESLLWTRAFLPYSPLTQALTHPLPVPLCLPACAAGTVQPRAAQPGHHPGAP